MSKNVAVFVDVANIFYAAKAAGVDIDYVTLLKAATAGRDLVRAYAYTGLDPDNENQRNFHDFLRRSNYKVVSKDIRKYGDGKVKANLDIELVVDMMKTARNLDIAIVVSGDGDFAPAIRAVQEQGVRVEVISFRGNTSSDLIEVADLFTDIVQLARVEKGTRSGRRVADDDADLSMTEVPDKQTEGSGMSRSRGRGRGRGRDAEPVAAASRGRTRTRSTSTAAEPAAAVAAGDGAGLVALPGERLSRSVGSLTEADLARAEVFTLDDLDEGAPETAASDRDAGPIDDGEEPRRRRRRGGRGRGRGRGQDDEGSTEGPRESTPRAAAPAANGSGQDAGSLDAIDEDEDAEAPPPRRTPRATPFGSVWDSQLGTPASAAPASRAPVTDDEDFDEPEIPEYLIAEQRRSGNRGGAGAGGGRGARGGRSAYQSAMERERYGRGGGGGGINRYPDVSGRTQQSPPPREDRGRGRTDRPSSAPAGRSSSEPWSDVPPELEAMLRAQVAQKSVPGRAAEPAPTPVDDRAAGSPEADSSAEESVATGTKARAPRKPATKPAAKATSKATATKAPAKPRSTSKAAAQDSDAAEVAGGATAEVAAPKARAPRKTASKSSTAAAATADGGDAPAAPAKRRSTRKPAAAADTD